MHRPLGPELGLRNTCSSCVPRSKGVLLHRGHTERERTEKEIVKSPQSTPTYVVGMGVDEGDAKNRIANTISFGFLCLSKRIPKCCVHLLNAHTWRNSGLIIILIIIIHHPILYSLEFNFDERFLFCRLRVDQHSPFVWDGDIPGIWHSDAAVRDNETPVLMPNPTPNRCEEAEHLHIDLLPVVDLYLLCKTSCVQIRALAQDTARFLGSEVHMGRVA